jgi:hypothetical protein
MGNSPENRSARQLDIQKVISQLEKFLAVRDFKGLLGYIDGTFPAFAEHRLPIQDLRESRNDFQLSLSKVS